MEEQAIKIRRSTIFIKAAMVVVVLMEVITFYQTKILNFGSIATTIGVLALFRGLLLSPLMFAAPVKNGFTPNREINSSSYKYFALAFILILVGLVRYV